MIVPRSFAPTDEDQPAASAAPPVFPLWPYACLAYADHCSRDYAAYVARLAEDPWQAEETLALHILHDMNNAWFSLVLAPFEAAFARRRASEAPHP